MLNRFGEFDFNDSHVQQEGSVWSEGLGQWTVIIPFHNESAYLPACLESLSRQTVRPRLILVDNGSTDGSAGIAVKVCNSLALDAVHVHEGTPGKVAALRRGLREVATEFVATCDADTIYPPHYLETAGSLLDRRGVVAAVAATCAPNSTARKARVAGLRLELTARLLPQQCLNGGAGQVFRTSALRGCGGFDPAIWNWVLEDHEIMARIERLGRIAYGRTFFCQPADRPRSIDCTGWNLSEQIRYHLTTGNERWAYFHEFLGPKLRQRALLSEKLRRCDGVPANA